MEKTELEKKWEEEDLKEISVEDEEIKEEDENHFVFVSVKGIEKPLVLIISEGIKYLALAQEINDDYLCTSFPLVFGEVPVEDNKGNIVGIQPKVVMVINCLDLLEEFYFRGNYKIYFLNNTKTKDKALAEFYRRSVEQVLIEESGLVAPTAKDMELIRK